MDALMLMGSLNAATRAAALDADRQFIALANAKLPTGLITKNAATKW